MQKKNNIIIGFHSGHDCSYCILEDGVPVVHEEYERLSRIKEGQGDGLKFFFERNPSLLKTASVFTHCHHVGGDETSVRELGDVSLFDKMLKMAKDRGGNYFQIGHHICHAAHAHYSSRFENSIIISMDAGGWELLPNKKSTAISSAVFRGKQNKINTVAVADIQQLNVAEIWQQALSNLFGLSNGPPKGNQAGTIMAMAAIGKTAAFKDIFYDCFTKPALFTEFIPEIKKYIEEDSQNKYSVSRGLQEATEDMIRQVIQQYIEPNDENLCFTGGVALNSVTMGKIKKWFPQIKDIFVPIVPYDGGLCIGAAQYIYHHIQNNPKLKNQEYFKPYLGVSYKKSDVQAALESRREKLLVRESDDKEVIDLLDDQKIVSIFNEKSESGRRALGNRSILADPRSDTMKDLINEKVKHRQWFRPFAPSILLEEVSNWFEYFVDSPYMGLVVPFKEEKRKEVPAVVHLDGTGRVQTVSKDINPWYHSFLQLWREKSGVPILLNTSFNDREPIVETPDNAINCFLNTDIDYLYFPEYGLLVSKND